MKVTRAAVVGAGIMGSGIAQVLSQAGIEVILKDLNTALVERGLANVKRMYESRVNKEVLTQAEADYLFAMVKGATAYNEFNEVDLVIEAALEQIEIKLEIFRELGKHCQAKTILATNTSALSVSEIAGQTPHPERVIGMHFFNPAQTMKLVEVIPGVFTEKSVIETVIELCRTLNKVPVKVQECPGFLVNRLLFTYLNEALYVLQEGIATVDEIDKAAVNFGFPMGPFTLLDMTGIDVCAHVTKFLNSEYGLRFTPAAILQLLVEKNWLGQKTGLGFFVHLSGQTIKKGIAKQVNPDLELLLEVARQKQGISQRMAPFKEERIILPMFNEAAIAIQENVVAIQDIDLAMEWGLGLTRGLLSLGEEKGLAWCVTQLELYQDTYGERFRPAWLLRKLLRAGIHDFASLYATPASVL